MLPAATSGDSHEPWLLGTMPAEERDAESEETGDLAPRDIVHRGHVW
ncbi:MAG TPA: hypothetical protein VIL98_11035 [Gaiellaceae bacterium]